MKFWFLSGLLIFLISCDSDKSEKVEENIQYVQTLNDPDGLWSKDTIDNGLIHYQFEKFYEPQNAFQFVNVVELDLDNKDYYLDFATILTSSPDILSNMANRESAVIGVNASYELDASFIKSNGHINNEITIGSDHLRAWKYEGAIFYNSDEDIKIDYGNSNSEYLGSDYDNIYSGSPMLIYNHELVGKEFVGDISDIDLDSLPYEDYRRHQGVRHPRTIYALTDENHLLLITIDGRFEESEGMTAEEATEFLHEFFEPKDALNMDGGGSTTMFVKGKGSKGIVNYPTDNGNRDHDGERKRDNFLLIKSN